MQKSILSCRAGKVRKYRGSGGTGPDLENNFVLRLPAAQASILKEDLRQGQANIKDRLAIQLDYTQDKEDMRNGIITFDTLMYKARLYDLPSILETWKTIDGKNFYKTADVCQMLKVMETDDPPEEEESKKKKRDPNKVDKKFLWPHGYTPPLKNVRKKRFRRTLRKKHIDLPDIEKEVKRLLRADNEAINTKWEIVREEDEKKTNISDDFDEPGNALDNEESNLDKENLFGDVSSSDDDLPLQNLNIEGDDDDDSRLSVEDSQSYINEPPGSPSQRMSQASTMSTSQLVTEFNPSMFNQDDSPVKSHEMTDQMAVEPKQATAIRFLDELDFNQLYSRLANLDQELTKLLGQRAAHQAETDTIENNTLKQKFLAKLAEFDQQIAEKEDEIKQVRSQLQDP